MNLNKLSKDLFYIKGLNQEEITDYSGDIEIFNNTEDWLKF